MRDRAADQGGRIRHWSAILVTSGWASQRKTKLGEEWSARKQNKLSSEESLG
jgi:hypothetical protein